MSNNAPEVHFGFPANVQQVDLELRGPDGVIETKKAVPLGQRLRWTRMDPV